MKKEILRIENVTLEERGITYLNQLNMHIFKGEIMGLIMMQELGKEQIIRLICYNDRIKYGRVYLTEELVNSYNGSQCSNNRVYVIEKKSKLIDDLSVADNIFVLRKGFRKYIIHKKVLNRQVEEYLKVLGIYINPNELVGKLSIFERCIVEFMKAVILGSRLIILYEISDLLGSIDLMRFQKIMKEYAQKGYTFLYVGSHHEEVFPISDRVAVMEEGRIIKVFEKDELKIENMSPFIISYANYQKRQFLKQEEDGILTFSHVKTEYIEDLSFSVKRGECITILDNNNQIFEDILQLIRGGKFPEEGAIALKMKAYRGTSEEEALEQGIAVISENPIRSMLFYEFSYMDNLCFLIDKKIKKSIISNRVKKSINREYRSELGEAIYARDITGLKLEDLYNLVYYRLYLYRPDMVICIQPFSGADMYLRKHIAELIKRFKALGISVVILAVRLADTLAVSDRLMVIENGRLLKEYPKEEFCILRGDYCGSYLEK